MHVHTDIQIRPNFACTTVIKFYSKDTQRIKLHGHTYICARARIPVAPYWTMHRLSPARAELPTISDNSNHTEANVPFVSIFPLTLLIKWNNYEYLYSLFKVVLFHIWYNRNRWIYFESGTSHFGCKRDLNRVCVLTCLERLMLTF